MILLPISKKTVILLCLTLFTFSLIVIAFDQHFTGSSPTCLICQTKGSIVGIETFFNLGFHPTIAYYVLEEYPVNLTIPIIFAFQNKSPPGRVS